MSRPPEAAFGICIYSIYIIDIWCLDDRYHPSIFSLCGHSNTIIVLIQAACSKVCLRMRDRAVILHQGHSAAGKMGNFFVFSLVASDEDVRIGSCYHELDKIGPIETVLTVCSK
jgi:hypothetical protein